MLQALIQPKPASLFGVMQGRHCRRHDSFCGINSLYYFLKAARPIWSTLHHISVKGQGSTPWLDGFRFMFAAPFNNNRLVVFTVQRKQLKQPSTLRACLSLHVAAWSLIHCDRSTPNLWTKYLHPMWIQIACAHVKLHFLQVTTLQKEGIPNISNNQLWPTPFWKRARFSDCFPGPTSNNLTVAALWWLAPQTWCDSRDVCSAERIGEWAIRDVSVCSVKTQDLSLRNKRLWWCRLV